MSRDEAREPLLAEAVTPLETTGPTSDSDDIRALGDQLADRRVVGLGEATHGTREFFELKHRIVRHLVTEHGFRLFGIEASFGETLAVNDYVLGGDGDPGAVVGEMEFWTWETDAVREFVEWVRAFNDGRPREDQVKCYGVDAQFVEASAARLADYLAGAAPDCYEGVADDLAALRDDDFKGGDQDAVRAQIDTACRLVDVLGSELDARRDALVDATSVREWGLARQHVTAIRQATALVQTHHQADEAFSADGLAAREQALADNVDWVLAHEPHDRIAVWAHNAHVKRATMDYDEADAPVTQMGGHLAARHGEDYYALCFDFDRGSFQAIGDLRDAQRAASEGDADDDDRGRRAFTVDAAPDDSLAATLRDTDHSLAFLDVDAASEEPALADWLSDEHRLRSIGAVFDDGEEAEYFDAVDLRSEVDGVLFVAETSRARPLNE